jgi:hypothetical protein
VAIVIVVIIVVNREGTSRTSGLINDHVGKERAGRYENESEAKVYNNSNNKNNKRVMHYIA